MWSRGAGHTGSAAQSRAGTCEIAWRSGGAGAVVRRQHGFIAEGEARKAGQ